MFLCRGGSTVDAVTIHVEFVEDKVTVEQGFRRFSKIAKKGSLIEI